MECFIHLGRGARVKGYLGIEEGTPFKFGNNYAYIEVGAGDIVASGKPVEDGVVKSGQRVVIKAACQVAPKGCRILVVVNQALSLAGEPSFQSVVEAGDSPEIIISYKPIREINIKELPWVVRLYGMI